PVFCRWASPTSLAIRSSPPSPWPYSSSSPGRNIWRRSNRRPRRKRNLPRDIDGKGPAYSDFGFRISDLPMIPVIVIAIYLAVIAFVGSIAFRRGKTNTEDFFLANRSVGEMVFFLSLFATNMTAFAILGSSGHPY